MTREEPYDANQPPPLDGSTETSYPRRSPAGRSQHQRSLPPPSDCGRPVLRLGEAGPPGGLDGLAKQPKRAQETRPKRSAPDRGAASAGSRGRTDVREPAPQKRVLAVGTNARH